MRLLLPLGVIILFGFAALVFGIRLFEAWSDDAAGAAGLSAATKTPQPSQRSVQAKNADNVFQSRSLAAYQDIIQRPLFFHDRRMPKPAPIVRRKPPAPKPPPRRVAPVSKPPPPPPPPTFSGVLHGVVLSGPIGKALISANGQAGKWYSQKQIVNGWQITAIEAGAVRLRVGKTQVMLKLHPSQRKR